MLAWEEIMKNAPTMKQIVEQKIAEEVAKKQAEIDELKQEKEMLGEIVAELDFRLMELEMGGM